MRRCCAVCSWVAPAAIWLSAVAFFLASLMKIISATRSAGILASPDPIFPLSNRQVYVFVGLLEGVVVVVLLSKWPQRVKLLLVAALSTNFLIYRLGLLWLGIDSPCPCLGNAADWLHASPKTLGLVTKLALWVLIALSYGALLLDRHTDAESCGVVSS